jgi:hypothetical protein
LFEDDVDDAAEGGVGGEEEFGDSEEDLGGLLVGELLGGVVLQVEDLCDGLDALSGFVFDHLVVVEVAGCEEDGGLAQVGVRLVDEFVVDFVSLLVLEEVYDAILDLL